MTDTDEQQRHREERIRRTPAYQLIRTITELQEGLRALGEHLNASRALVGKDLGLPALPPPLSPPATIHQSGDEVLAPAAVEKPPRAGRPPGKDLHPEVREYIRHVGQASGRNITFRDFAKAAGYSDDTLLKAWRRGDTKRATKAHEEIFQKVLRMPPADFIAALDSGTK